MTTVTSRTINVTTEAVSRTLDNLPSSVSYVYQDGNDGILGTLNITHVGAIITCTATLQGTFLGENNDFSFDHDFLFLVTVKYALVINHNPPYGVIELPDSIIPVSFRVSFNLPAITITPVTPVYTKAGTVYSRQYSASGTTAPYTFTATGVPTGLSISSAGLVSGTPTSLGNFDTVIKVTDGASAFNVIRVPHTINAVSQGDLVLTIPSLSGQLGAPYSKVITASGTSVLNYNFTVTGLPSGLTGTKTANNQFTITGTPLALGTSSVVFEVTTIETYPVYGSRTVSAVISAEAPTPLTVTPATITGTVGTAYSQQFTASNGTAPYTFSATNLPAGLTISSSGLVSGTPTTATSGAIINQAYFTVTDSNSIVELITISFSIAAALKLTITPEGPFYGRVAEDFSQQFSASGGTPPYVFSATSLPQALSISEAGLVAGKPYYKGTYYPIITATDSNGKTGTLLQRSFYITDSSSGTIVFTVPDMAGYVGVYYTKDIRVSADPATATGDPVITGLPTGLLFRKNKIALREEWYNEITIYGTPITAGTSSVTISAVSTANVYGSTTFDIVISEGTPPPPYSGTIEGTLRLDTSEGSVAARKVYLYNYTTGAKLAETTSDAVTGEWGFTGLAAGDYFVVGVATPTDVETNHRDFDAMGVITVV